jgi:hypothetical protein
MALEFDLNRDTPHAAQTDCIVVAPSPTTA